MRKHDSTKYLRQMFHRPNIVSLSIFWFVLLLTVVILTPWASTSYGSRSIDIPDAINDDIVPLEALPLIILYKDGRVHFHGCHILDISKFTGLIIEKVEKWQLEEDKIFLEIDGDVPFGRVQEVLRAVQKAEVEEVVFITQTYASLAHFFNFVKQ